MSSLVERRTGFTVLGAFFLVWISTRLVATLRVALREIFDIGQQRGVLMGKLFDIQAVLISVSLLTLNLGVTVAFEATMDYGVGLSGVDGNTFSLLGRLLGHGLALGSIWTLFLIGYRYLPARRIPWRTAWVAATFSALLHEALK